MAYIPTSYDIDLLNQINILYQIKAEILNSNGTVLNELNGIASGGTINIDSESDIRRTASLTIVPTDEQSIKIAEDSLIWLNKDVHIYIGIQDSLTKKFTWFSQGYFVFNSADTVYDGTTNQLTISCNDFMAKLDGTKNGQIGALTTKIPAYEEDSEGNVIKYNIIKDAFITILTKIGNITKYNIDDIGEFKAMPEYNTNWETYRSENPQWNCIPYDLEFSTGINILSIITELRDLYPNYEAYFDENNVFVCKMIPSGSGDPVLITNDFLQALMINENTNTSMTGVKNICQVWGEVFDVTFCATSCNTTSNTYNLVVDSYGAEYFTGDTIGFIPDTANIANMNVKINSLGLVPIYDENTESPIAAGSMQPGTMYATKIKKQYISGSYVYKLYLLGIYQVQALSVLTDGTVIENGYTHTDSTVMDMYSVEYFQTVYNCKNVELVILPSSPFTVQKLGEHLETKSGTEYDSITSNSLALARARYELYKCARLPDSITLTTILIPWLDVNIKAEYKLKDSNSINQYLIKSVSHDYETMQTTINMMRFYPLYEE